MDELRVTVDCMLEFVNRQDSTLAQIGAIEVLMDALAEVRCSLMVTTREVG